MQKGFFGFPVEYQNQSPYWPYKSLALHFKREFSGSGVLVVPPGIDEVIACLHGAGGGGGSWVIAGSEAGGGGGGAMVVRKFKVSTGWRFVYAVGAKGNGGNPAGTNGGNSTLSVYDVDIRLVATITANGGTGAPGNAATPGTGGTYSETTTIATDQLLLKATSGNAGQAGGAQGNDIGGSGGDTLIRAFDPLDTRPRGIGSQVNNGATVDAVAIGSGGGGGVGSGIGSDGKAGCFWAVMIPKF